MLVVTKNSYVPSGRGRNMHKILETVSPAAIISTVQFKNTYFVPFAYQALC